MASKKRYYRRAFLNRPNWQTTAFVLAEVSGPSDLTFNLSDCERLIKLDFSGYSAGGRKNSLYKANLLIETLTAFRDAMVAEWELHPPRRDDY